MRQTGSFSQVFLHRDPVDMRKGINGLLAIIQIAQMGDWKSNALFVFCGKRRHTLKVLYFDRTGFCLWMKRIERDRFRWPKSEQNVVKMSPEQLDFLLEGYDLSKMKPFAKLQIEGII
jgi:transposase